MFLEVNKLSKGMKEDLIMNNLYLESVMDRRLSNIICFNENEFDRLHNRLDKLDYAILLMQRNILKLEREVFDIKQASEINTRKINEVLVTVRKRLDALEKQALGDKRVCDFQGIHHLSTTLHTNEAGDSFKSHLTSDTSSIEWQRDKSSRISCG